MENHKIIAGLYEIDEKSVPVEAVLSISADICVFISLWF